MYPTRPHTWALLLILLSPLEPHSITCFSSPFFSSAPFLMLTHSQAPCTLLHPHYLKKKNFSKDHSVFFTSFLFTMNLALYHHLHWSRYSKRTTHLLIANSVPFQPINSLGSVTFDGNSLPLQFPGWVVLGLVCLFSVLLFLFLFCSLLRVPYIITLSYRAPPISTFLHLDLLLGLSVLSSHLCCFSLFTFSLTISIWTTSQLAFPTLIFWKMPSITSNMLLDVFAHLFTLMEKLLRDKNCTGIWRQ